jgi:hypothetical protein
METRESGQLRRRKEKKMLTLKLCRERVTRIVEVESVIIYPQGKTEGSDDDPYLLSNLSRLIAATKSSGETEDFYIAKKWDDVDTHMPRPEGPFDFWHRAYIENAEGATTEAVYPDEGMRTHSTKSEKKK